MTARIGGQAAAIALLLAAAAAADTIVTFPDPNLEAAVREALAIPAPTPITDAHMLSLTHFTKDLTGIADLGGLEYALNLSGLDIQRGMVSDLSPLAGLIKLNTLMILENRITDITPLAGLTNLRPWVSLDGNQITDLTPLSGLSKLECLTVSRNAIADISPIAGLTVMLQFSAWNNLIEDVSALASLQGGRLRYLDLHANRITDIAALSLLDGIRTLNLDGNRIQDISALAAHHKLSLLMLQGNPLNQEAYDVWIPLITENNPGIRILYDPIPEPGCLGLLGMGALALGCRRRFSRTA